MNILPKVLLACPISNVKDYCLWDWIENIKKFTYPNYDIFLVDNSKDKNFYKKILDKGIECEHIDHTGNIKETMAYSMNIIRDRVMLGGYDYFFSLECDLFPPNNIIEWLLHYNENIIGCNYFLGDLFSLGPMATEIDYNYAETRLVAYTNYEIFHKWDGNLHKVFALGLGCVMIKSYALNWIIFRSTTNKGEICNEIPHPDTFFMADANKFGFSVYMDTNIIIEHRRGDIQLNKKDWGVVKN